MSPDDLKLFAAVLKEHPGPWKVQSGNRDNGSRYENIVDANAMAVLDGEYGILSEPAFNLLLNLPEIAESVRSGRSAVKIQKRQTP